MSGRKNNLPKFQIVSAGDMSQATVASTVVNIEHLDNISIQTNILTGTATGTIDVQVSIDHVEVNGNVKVAGNWITIGSPSTQAITSGAPANSIIRLSNIPEPYIRLLYTKTGGTGTFDSFIAAKML